MKKTWVAAWVVFVLLAGGLLVAEVRCVDRGGRPYCVVVGSCWERMRDARPFSAVFDWLDGFCRW